MPAKCELAVTSTSSGSTDVPWGCSRVSASGLTWAWFFINTWGRGQISRDQGSQSQRTWRVKRVKPGCGSSSGGPGPTLLLLSARGSLSLQHSQFPLPQPQCSLNTAEESHSHSAKASPSSADARAHRESLLAPECTHSSAYSGDAQGPRL